MPLTENEMPLTIAAEPATMAAFAPYGTLLAFDRPDDAGHPVNQGRARRQPGLRDLAHNTAASRPVLDRYRIEASALPFPLVCFERHPLTAQVFVPLQAARLMVAVAPDDNGRPDIGRARAFIVNRAIIHYRAGVWHAPLVALDMPAMLAMLMWETGDARDCEEFFPDEPIMVSGG
jgi:ureidoglycolate lyase